MTSINRSSGANAPRETPRTDGPGKADEVGQTSAAAATEDLEGVEDIDVAAGQTVTDGMSMGAPTRSTDGIDAVKGGAPARPAQYVDASDVTGVTALVADALDGLKPGEVVSVGAGVEAGELVLGAYGVKASVERTSDGTFKVSLEEAGGVGIGLKGHLGPAAAVIKEMVGVSTGVELTFGSAEEAAAFLAEVGDSVKTGLTAGSSVPGSAMVIIHALMAKDLYDARANVSGARVDVTATASGELGTKTEIFQAKLNISGTAKSTIGFEAPDTYYLEVAIDEAGGIGAGASTGVDGGLAVGGAGVVTGSTRVRVPLSPLKPGESLEDASVQARLMAEAAARFEEGTVTVEAKVEYQGKSMVTAGLVTTKSVSVADAGKLFDDDGWDPKYVANVGPNVEFGIGPVSATVVAQKQFTIDDPPPGSFAQQIAEAQANEAALQAKALAQAKARSKPDQ